MKNNKLFFLLFFLPSLLFASNKIQITGLTNLLTGIRYTFHIHIKESNIMNTNFFGQLEIISETPKTTLSENQINIIKGTNLETLTIQVLTTENLFLKVKDKNNILANIETNFLVISPEQENNFAFLELSEVMYDTDDDVYDWFEFYNNSNNPIDLQNKIVAFSYKTSPPSGDYFTITSSIPTSTFILQPHSVVIFVNDIDHFRLIYPMVYDKIEHKMADYSNTIIIPISDSFPAITANSSDKCFSIKTNLSSANIGWGYYDGDWGEKKYYSLERNNYNISSLNPENWHLSYIKYGTPGKQNSSLSSNTLDINNENQLVLSSSTLQQHDSITIGFNLKDNIQNANLFVLSSTGHFVKILASNLSIQSNQDYTYTFDGTDVNNNILPIGLYIITLKGYTQQNKKIQISKVLVIVKKL